MTYAGTPYKSEIGHRFERVIAVQQRNTKPALIFLAFVLTAAPALPAAADSLVDSALQNTVNRGIDRAAANLDKLLKERIADFLAEGEKVSNRLLEKGANEARLGLFQAGNEMQIAIGVARSQLGAEGDRLIGSASAELRPLLVEIQRWRDAEGDLVAKAFELEDLLAMDLSRVPFAPDYFGVRRLSGTAMLEKKAGSYRIGITGDNFGSTIVGQLITVTAKLGDVPLAAPDKQAPAKVFFSVPAESLGGKFKNDKIETVPLYITVTRKKDGYIYGSKTTVLEHEVKLALLPREVGDLVVETTRPQYEWVVDAPLIQSHAITQDTPFLFKSTSPVVAGKPLPGNKRFENAIVAKCEAMIQNAWKLHNGEIVLDSDLLIQKGWESDFYIGEPQNYDWDKADRIATARFGWTPGFSHNRCEAGSRCHLSPDEVKSHSQATTTTSVNECGRMRMAEQNFENDDSSVSVSIRGNAPHSALWTVTVPVSIYKQAGTKKDDSIVIPIIASEPAYFDIKSSSGSVSTLHFRPKNDSERFGVLPGSVPKGPQYVREATLGDATRFFYQFDYNPKLFDVE
ncbi:hypothetical protein [Bradyrhizobium erythrophlei]|uniref:Uncharacterized protein n=1 Tax=Bradyrhizobium erythrophlei TaxID=1437360 RepID=A0A1H5D1N3_9BRAD|nr:hypothetical protein [Bradyrhizobium erythrophlei]SED72741.1 hypothetical protein SAMN05444164_5605 [Bradyrhizobium erythrophlei]